MATSAILPADTDWFDANFRQVLGVGGAADAGRPLASPQVLNALGKRFTRVVDPSSHHVTFARNGEPLQLMDDPAEVDSLIATFAASQLGGPRAALATIEDDLSVPWSCDGDAGRALAAIRETLDTLIEVSARRDGALRTQLLVSQLIGSTVMIEGNRESAFEFGLVLRLRRRLAQGHVLAPSFALERALGIIDQAIDAIRSFGVSMGTRATDRARPLHDVVETLHNCALHISHRVIEIRRTLAGLGIGQCELDRANLPRTAISIPDLFAALESQPGEWRHLIDGATPDSAAAIAASARSLADIVDGLSPDIFAGLFNVGQDAGAQLSETWARFGTYTSAVLRDLHGSLERASAAASAVAGQDMDDDLINAPAEEQKPLKK